MPYLRRTRLRIRISPTRESFCRIWKTEGRNEVRRITRSFFPSAAKTKSGLLNGLPNRGPIGFERTPYCHASSPFSSQTFPERPVGVRSIWQQYFAPRATHASSGAAYNSAFTRRSRGDETRTGF